MTFTIYTVAFALALSACSGAPTERVAAESSPIVDAGPPCKNGGHEVSTLFASYGYYDTADGLISCQNFAYATAQTVCIYQTSEYQASELNLCASLTAASSCAYSMRVDMGNMHTDANETDYYLNSAYGSLDALRSSCANIGGKWKVQ